MTIITIMSESVSNQPPQSDLVSLLSVCLSVRSLGRLQESSQDSLQDDSFVSSAGPDQFSTDTGLFSGSDSDTQQPPTPCWDQERPLQVAPSSSSSPSPFHSSQDDDPHDSPSALVSAPSGSDGLRPAEEPEEEEKEEVCPGGAPPPTALSRKLSSDSLLVSPSPLLFWLRPPTLSPTMSFTAPLSVCCLVEQF